MAFKSPNYTQVPNDFWDMLPDMTDAEIRVMLVMIRETFGYHRKSAKVGFSQLQKRSGLKSYNGAVLGARAAEARGTIKRSNPDDKKQAIWELCVETPSAGEGSETQTPSASEGDSTKHPQPVRVTPSASEGQVGLNKERNNNKETGFDTGGKCSQIQAEAVFRKVTNLLAMPNNSRRNGDIESIMAMVDSMGEGEAITRLSAAWKWWNTRTTKDGRKYSRTNTAWIDYAMTGDEISKPKSIERTGRKPSGI